MSSPAISREVAPRGNLRLVKLSDYPGRLSLKVLIKHALPRPGLAPGVAMWRLKNLPNLWRGLRTVMWAKIHRIPTLYGTLWLTHVKANGEKVQYGLASARVVTTAGVNFIRDDFNNGAQDVSTMKYHGFGTGTNAEATGDTALQTELTTEYATDNTRPTGTQTTNGTGVYETVATLDPDNAVTITEHGIFSQAANSGGTLLDRSKFTGVAVAASGDSLQATYDFTITAGS